MRCEKEYMQWLVKVGSVAQMNQDLRGDGTNEECISVTGWTHNRWTVSLRSFSVGLLGAEVTISYSFASTAMYSLQAT